MRERTRDGPAPAVTCADPVPWQEAGALVGRTAAVEVRDRDGVPQIVLDSSLAISEDP